MHFYGDSCYVSIICSFFCSFLGCIECMRFRLLLPMFAVSVCHAAQLCVVTVVHSSRLCQITLVSCFVFVFVVLDVSSLTVLR